MRIDVTLDGMDKLEDFFSAKAFSRANRRTTRRIGQRFKTNVSKAVREEYNIPAKRLKSSIKTQYSATTEGGYQYRFYAKGRTINLIHFGARTLKSGVVSVKAVKRGGPRIKLHHAFIGKDMAGRMRVFERRGKNRLPLRGLNTLSVPQMFNKEIIGNAISDVESHWMDELRHNIRYYAGVSS